MPRSQFFMLGISISTGGLLRHFSVVLQCFVFST
uniref:Uncharacterized protein n=1 Tax=Arundo donax TaxID=35708 RepID=A0A0A8XSA4_ARUDO